MKKLKIIKTIMLVGVFALSASASLFGITKAQERTNNTLKNTNPVYFRIADQISGSMTPSNREYTAATSSGAAVKVGGQDVKLIFNNPKNYGGRYNPQYSTDKTTKYRFVGHKPEQGAEISVKVAGSTFNYSIGSERLEKAFVTINSVEYEIGVSFRIVNDDHPLFTDSSDKSTLDSHLICIEHVKQLSAQDSTKKAAEEAKKKAADEALKVQEVKAQQKIAEDAQKDAENAVDAATAKKAMEIANKAVTEAEKIASGIPHIQEALDSVNKAKEAADNAKKAWEEKRRAEWKAKKDTDDVNKAKAEALKVQEVKAQQKIAEDAQKSAENATTSVEAQKFAKQAQDAADAAKKLADEIPSNTKAGDSAKKAQEAATKANKSADTKKLAEDAAKKKAADDAAKKKAAADKAAADKAAADKAAADKAAADKAAADKAAADKAAADKAAADKTAKDASKSMGMANSQPVDGKSETKVAPEAPRAETFADIRKQIQEEMDSKNADLPQSLAEKIAKIRARKS